jgi:hypothetical protein
MRAPDGVSYLQRDKAEGRIKLVQVSGIGGHDRLIGAAGADYDVCVSDVGRSGGGKEPPDAGCVDSTEIDHIGYGLTDQPGKSGLARRLANGLR